MSVEASCQAGRTLLVVVILEEASAVVLTVTFKAVHVALYSLKSPDYTDRL